MSTLQERVYAKKWLTLAIDKNKLADFAIGLPPYAKQKTNDLGIPEPVLVPNLESLYDYYEKHKEMNFDRDVESAVLQLVEDEGDNACIIFHTLMFILTQLSYEKRGSAKFTLDCSRLLGAIKEKAEQNKGKLNKKNGNDVWRSIEFYDHHLREQYGLHLL